MIETEGVGIGFAIGAIAGYASGDDLKGQAFPLSAGDKAMLAGSGLALVGALGGALVAAMEVPTWVSVPVGRTSLRVAPVDGGLALSIRFGG